MSKGSTNLAVIFTDNTGAYLQESHAVLKSYFIIGATARVSATLVKLDKNLAEMYRNDFNKELRGKEFEYFFTVDSKLFILASDYNRHEKTLTLYAALVDKGTGELAGDWQQMGSWQKEEKSDDINYKLASSADSTTLFLVSSIEGSGRNNYQVQEFDKNLKALGKPINMYNEFDPKTFQLEDVIYTTSKKFVLVGRVYEYQEGKRKRNKYLDFAHYSIRIYDNKGKMQTDIKTDINAKWLISTKVLQKPDKDLVIAAFYSDGKKGQVNGLLIQRIDPGTGNVISTTQKEINTSLITPIEDDNSSGDDDKDDDSRKERKERERLDKIKDDNEGFASDMRFRNIFYTPDNGLVITAERYHSYTYTTTSTYTPSVGGFGSTTTMHTYTVFETGDLMMCKADALGNINWLQVLPKQQREIIDGGYSYGAGFSVGMYYFSTTNWPRYSGFGALQGNNKINIIFNDNPRNGGVLQLGQKIKMARMFGKSDCFSLVLDVTTGKYTRSVLFSNKDVPTAMPRLSSYIGNDMYLIGRDDRLFGRTKVAVAKITATN